MLSKNIENYKYGVKFLLLEKRAESIFLLMYPLIFSLSSLQYNPITLPSIGRKKKNLAALLRYT